MPILQSIENNSFIELFSESSIPWFYLTFAETLAQKFGNNTLSLKWMLLILALHFREGHLRMTKDSDFWRACFQKWFSEKEKARFESAFENMLSERNALIENNPLLFASAFASVGDWKPILYVQYFFYFQKTFRLEQRFIQALEKFQKTPIPALSTSTQESIFRRTLEHWALTASFPLNEAQCEAIRLCLQKKLLLVTGGPGTGKTTLLINLLRALLYGHRAQNPNLPIRILLTAPTGKAAGGLAENLCSFLKSSTTLNEQQKSVDSLLPIEGVTLHRVLNEVRYLYKRYGIAPLIPADIIAIDEASMADVSLLADFFEALPPQAHLILIGDKNQLPAIESGSVFSDLIVQKQDTEHLLKEQVIFLNQAKRSVPELSHLASAVLEGDLDSVMQQLSFPVSGAIEYWDFESNPWSRFPETIFQHFSKLRDAAQNFSPDRASSLFSLLKSFKILCAVQEGKTGVEFLNEQCRKILGENSAALFPGMPLMISKNDHAQTLWNGDQGILVRSAEGTLRALFPHREGFREFAPTILKHSLPSFAMTIHKSQGAEFDTIFLLLPEEPLPLLTREILYTGITRAKKRLILVAKKNVLEYTLHHHTQRDSGIRDFLTGK